MLKSKKSFVVTIGNYGAVIALHDGNEIKNKIFLETLTEESKSDLKILFSKNHFIPIFILLDTTDQSYKKKSYPQMRLSDLQHIIRRDLASDGDHESLKSYIIEKKNSSKNNKNPNKAASKTECLFISAATGEIVTPWIDFLLEMPNHVPGIYLLPIESFSFLNLIKKDIISRSKAKKIGSEEVIFLILHNKVSGVRQIVFNKHGIVFTRCMNYSFNEPDFLGKYEQDIYSTFEYIKRLIPDLHISEIHIANVFSSEILEKIKSITSPELNFVNYSPCEAAEKCNFKKILPANANYCDLILSRSFSNSKKLLKFTNFKIKILEKYFITIKSSFYFNVGMSFAIFFACLYLSFSSQNMQNLIEAEKRRALANQELRQAKFPEKEQINVTENGNIIEAERIIDFGKIEESLGSVGIDIEKYYAKMRFLKNSDVKLTSFSYKLQSFNYKTPVNSGYIMSFNGDLNNKSGDIDDLFKSFDILTRKTQQNFPRENIKYNEIPRNIDFVQKYYTFPIEFTLSN